MTGWTNCGEESVGDGRRNKVWPNELHVLLYVCVLALHINSLGQGLAWTWELQCSSFHIKIALGRVLRSFAHLPIRYIRPSSPSSPFSHSGVHLDLDGWMPKGTFYARVSDQVPDNSPCTRSIRRVCFLDRGPAWVNPRVQFPSPSRHEDGKGSAPGSKLYSVSSTYLAFRHMLLVINQEDNGEKENASLNIDCYKSKIVKTTALFLYFQVVLDFE